MSNLILEFDACDVNDEAICLSLCLQDPFLSHSHIPLSLSVHTLLDVIKIS